MEVAYQSLEFQGFCGYWEAQRQPPFAMADWLYGYNLMEEGRLIEYLCENQRSPGIYSCPIQGVFKTKHWSWFVSKNLAGMSPEYQDSSDLWSKYVVDYDPPGLHTQHETFEEAIIWLLTYYRPYGTRQNF